MATQTTQGGQVVLVLTTSEAKALCDVCNWADAEINEGNGFGSYSLQRHSFNRAYNALVAGVNAAHDRSQSEA